MGERIFVAPSLRWLKMMWRANSEQIGDPGRASLIDGASVEDSGRVVLADGSLVTFRGMVVFIGGGW